MIVNIVPKLYSFNFTIRNKKNINPNNNYLLNKNLVTGHNDTMFWFICSKTEKKVSFKSDNDMFY